MKRTGLKIFYGLFALLVILPFSSCKKVKDITEQFNQQPEIGSLQQGLKSSAAVAYCASVVWSAIQDRTLPENVQVTFNGNSGFMYIHIDNSHPLPFNKNVGDIVIAFTWDDYGHHFTPDGVMSILLTDVDILGGSVKMCGIYTVPFKGKTDDPYGISTMFSHGDVLFGQGSDTILNLSNITGVYYNEEVSRLDQARPGDVFGVMSMNTWFIDIDQRLTDSTVYDDNLVIIGGGVIEEVKGSTGGILMHAIIDAEVNYSVCTQNPVSGSAFTQNVEAGAQPLVDLGNSYLTFHNNCDGTVHVEASTGKYGGWWGRDIPLNLY